jgi:taurine dioxygenase
VNLPTIGDREFEIIHEAFLDYLVLVVRNQRFTMEEFLHYSRRFGCPVPHITKSTRHPDYPELTVMGLSSNASVGAARDAILKRGEGWHTDTAFLEEPAIATQLHALQLPSYGGDTLFANMYAAYDALPERLKERIESLQARYRCGGKEQATIHLLDEEERKRPPALHPVVRVHPETGRKALYVNPVHILGIVGASEAESDQLLEELFGRMIQPGCEYRHKWQVGDVVIWDNRCAIHSATGGYPVSEPRIHWRTTIMANRARQRSSAPHLDTA